MSNDVYKAPQSLLDDVSDTTDQTTEIRSFITVILLFIVNIMMAISAWYLGKSGYTEEVYYQVGGGFWLAMLLLYAIVAGIFAKNVGKRGMLWGAMILLFQPVSLFVSFILIIGIGRNRKWFRAGIDKGID